MPRIFTALALFAVAFMAATLLLGLVVGDLHGPTDLETRRLATVHRLSGLAAALAVVLVNSIVMTYFIGTARWCREVVETYALSPELIERGSKLKRRSFPWAISGMLAVVGVVALGGAADPATLREGTEDWVTPHLIGALAGLVFVAWTFWVQSQRIAEQHALIGEVLAEVARIRKQRGLE